MGPAQVVAANATRGFQVLQCFECAENVRKALVTAGHQGQVIEIRARWRDFMVCFSYDGGQTRMTDTGHHVGVQVGDLVFDNLHPDGMPYGDWLQDFDGLGGVLVVSVTNF